MPVRRVSIKVASPAPAPAVAVREAAVGFSPSIDWSSVRDKVVIDVRKKRRPDAWKTALRPSLVAKSAEEKKKAVGEILRQGTVVTTAERDAAAVEFWKQGDLALNTEDAIMLRMKLRHHPKIISALLVWWETALRSAGSHDPEGRGELTRPEHEMLMIRLHRSMIPGWDRNSVESRIEIAEEWISDSKGRETLCRDDYFDALFELADMWTSLISADEYYSFLWKLLERISYVHGDPWYGVDEDGSPVARVWKNVKDIEEPKRPPFIRGKSKRTKAQERKAALAIQTAQRRLNQQKEANAKYIQRVARGREARKRLEGEREDGASTVLQAAWRSKQARFLAEQARKEKEEEAMAAQEEKEQRQEELRKRREEHLTRHRKSLLWAQPLPHSQQVLQEKKDEGYVKARKQLVEGGWAEPDPLLPLGASFGKTGGGRRPPPKRPASAPAASDASTPHEKQSAAAAAYERRLAEMGKDTITIPSSQNTAPRIPRGQEIVEDLMPGSGTGVSYIHKTAHRVPPPLQRPVSPVRTGPTWRAAPLWSSAKVELPAKVPESRWTAAGAPRARPVWSATKIEIGKLHAHRPPPSAPSSRRSSPRTLHRAAELSFTRFEDLCGQAGQDA